MKENQIDQKLQIGIGKIWTFKKTNLDRIAQETKSYDREITKIKIAIKVELCRFIIKDNKIIDKTQIYHSGDQNQVKEGVEKDQKKKENKYFLK